MVETAAPEARSSTPLLALADQCVQCGLCLPHCPTYRLDATEAESPRGRIAYMKAVAGGQLSPTALGDLHLDHCLGCRRCESVCPAGVQYGALLAGARAGQFARKVPRATDRLRSWLMASPRSLRWLLNTYRVLYPLLPMTLRTLPRPAPGGPPIATTHGAEVAIFVGCVAGAYEPRTRAGLLQLLAAVGVKASMPDAQACCGTAAVHAGDELEARMLAGKNRAAFAGRTKVLSLASGCQETLAASLRGISEVEDALAFLEPHGSSLHFRSARGRRVALHLPCSQRSVPRSDGALRRLLAKVPDLELIDLPDTGCCGAAGLHMLKEPERAAALRAPLLQSLAKSGAQELLSANIGCRLHLANASSLPIRHPIEFLAEHLV